MEEGPEERYDRILREHGASLRRVAALYEAERSRREDLFQEICLALWLARPRFRGESSERTFVFRIAHNRGLTHGWRQGRAKPLDLEQVQAVPDPRPDPEAAAAAQQRRERLGEAIAGLPLGQRQVLALVLEGLSQREAAEVLGLTENNVAVRLNRARQALRQVMGGEGGSR